MSMVEKEKYSAGRPACSACKSQRKRCQKNCLMAPHFPENRDKEFKMVVEVFGFSKIKARLKEVDPAQQEEAIKSLIWEASMWRKDPVCGPLGHYKRLEEDCRLLKELNITQQHQLQLQLQSVAPLEALARPQESIASNSHGGHVVAPPTAQMTSCNDLSGFNQAGDGDLYDIIKPYI